MEEHQILDPEYLKALDGVNIQELNKMIHSLIQKGGSNLMSPLQKTSWMAVNNTPLLANVSFDTTKKRFYVSGLTSKVDLQKEMETLSIGGSKKRPVKPKNTTKPDAKPSKPIKMSKPKKIKGGGSADKAFHIDYEDIEEYGGQK